MGVQREYQNKNGFYLFIKEIIMMAYTYPFFFFIISYDGKTVSDPLLGTWAGSYSPFNVEAINK